MNSRQQLAKTIAKRTLDEKDLNQLTKEVAAYLLAENQSANLSSIMRDVMAYRAEFGHIEANIISAHPLDAKLRDDITLIVQSAFPDSKHIVINESIDENVVGGLRIEMANLQLDNTVQAKLNTLKRRTAARKDI